ncbi:MAG: hypothetical protein RRZ85_09280 [Gordonibacter sp.]|uniref:hypothetical protein n=1 Tax=Gordonibacter sp. TaxID=1968902 RepID=UPI002FCB8192
MKIVISHNSALEYWRSSTPPQQDSPCTAKARTLDRQQPSLAQIENLGLRQYGVLSEPVHVLARGSKARKPTGKAGHHTSIIELPEGALVGIATCGSGKLYVSSPELCFIQMAGQFTLPQLIELGFEFCGLYSLTDNDPRGFFPRHPLTSIEKLRKFSDRSGGLHGTKLAQRALRFVVPNAASPRETALTMLLCLPCALGGYGLDKPELNFRRNADRRNRRLSDKSFYRCDLCWPERKLAVEYDSDLHHTGSERIASDSRRRNALTSLGMTMLSVTKKQINNYTEFDRASRQIARHLGKRIQPRSKDFVSKQFELRAYLLGRTISPKSGYEGDAPQ